MTEFDFSLSDAPPEWRQVLLAYHEGVEPVAASPSVADEELVSRGFRPRVREVAGIPREQMARIHGKLIAHGLLQVEIAGRTGGMLYQLTSAGRKACLQLSDVLNDREPSLVSA
jgi:hypothetical protein